MLQVGSPLVDVLRRKLGPEGAQAALQEAGSELRVPEEERASAVCAAYSLLKLNYQADEISRALSWQDFELLSGAILRASGYQVRNNVVLRKPRAQIDLVASGTSSILSVDCKHYRRGQGVSSLKAEALAQLRRSGLLRANVPDSRPIVSVILSMSEPEGSFVEGVAVVPIRTLRSFLTTIESYMGLLAQR